MGRPYPTPPVQGGSGGTGIIMTAPLAAHLRANERRPYALPLPVGRDAVRRARRRIGLDQQEWDDHRFGWWIDRIEDSGRTYGMPDARVFTPDRWLEDGDVVTLGETEFEVLHTPGHTPGHIVFFHREARFAQVGDVLFQGSIGRTDFPRGNHADLIRAITTRLWPLGGQTAFIPGHGPMSTFAAERRSNAYVADAVLARA